MAKSEYIGLEEWELIEKIVPENIRYIIEIMLSTGMRVGDVVNLRPSQIDGNVVEYVAQKTGKAHRAVLNARSALRMAQPPYCRGVWVFESNKDPRKHVSRQNVWYHIKAAQRKLSLPVNVSPHSARKTFAVDLFNKKGLDETREELQHDSLSTTLLYAFADKLGREVGEADKRENCRTFAKMVAREVVALLSENKRKKG